MNTLEKIDRGLRHLEAVLMTIATLALFAIMLIIFADVAARYFFNAPFAWTYDLISLYLVVGAFFLALSDTLQKNRHVNVDIVFRHVSIWTGHTLYSVSYLLASVGLAGIAWEGALRTISAVQAGEVTSGVIAWPTWVGVACVALGVGLLVVRVAFRAIAHAIAAAMGNDQIPGVPARLHLGDDI